VHSRRPVIAALTLAAALGCAGVPATARADDAWATVNVCDTAARPDTIGIRGSMPGLDRPATVLMRFRVQYRDQAGMWRTLSSDRADSGWVRLGRSTGADRQAGWSFSLRAPAHGGSYRLRGRVTFKWRRAGATVRRRRAYTEAGHPNTEGADPPGYSAAECVIR
jgi:hypothetical protein